MLRSTSRRAFIKGALLTPAAAAVTLEARGAAEGIGAPGPAAESLPQGRIGRLAVSRLLLGGNLLTHFTHSRDLKYVYNLAAHYNTDAKILETLALAERHGINTLVVHTVPAILKTLKTYREERGGTIQWIICSTAPVEPGLERYRASIEQLVRDGVDAIYLWGVTADRLVDEGYPGLIKEAVALAKEYGVPSGVGAHDLRVVQECERLGVPNDFYIKTLHHHQYPTGPKPEEIDGPYNEIPGYWCQDPAAVVETMKAVEKPWIAFKVMAAGAIPPKDAFRYAFEQGADHVLAGMFDFEIEEDAALISSALDGLNRERPWRS